MMHVDPQPLSDAAKLDAACAKGSQLQLAGQLDAAAQLYHAVLLASPQHAAANYYLGMLHVQAHRTEEALPHLKAALLTGLEIPDFWLGYLEALLIARRLDAAANILALGRQHGLAGEAVEEFARRLGQATGTTPRIASPDAAPEPVPPVTSRPGGAEACTAAPAAPVRLTRKARRQRDREAARGETDLLRLVGRRDAAAVLSAARELTRRFPERGIGWKILGAFMPTEQGFTEAHAALETAVGLLPEDAEAHVNLGVTLAKMHRFAEAESHLLAAMKLAPTLAAAHYRLGMTYELQGRYADAEACLRRGRGIALDTANVAGDDELSFSHLLFIMSHNPAIGPQELFAEHRRFGEHVEAPLRAAWPRHTNDRQPERTLKLGFVSGDLHEHSVGQFLEPLVAQLKRRPGLTLHAYRSQVVEDGLSRRLQGHFATWTDVGGLSDAEFAARIAHDRIDVLIDLSGHTGYSRLPVFARKPAPVQVSWLGYPGTTGLTAVDYYLADPNWLPPGRFDHLFTEKLAYLPDRWAFTPHAGASPVGPLPALGRGHLTFGSFHRLGKINEPTIALWSKLLLALPEATLLLVGIRQDAQQRQLLERLAAHGIAPGRLSVHPRSTMDVYLGFHHGVDIALDTLAYSGATTTMHSLSMGVPTLTIAGSTPQAHACAGILGNLGLDAFVAADADEYVAKACHWAAHLDELAALRADLRPRLLRSPGGRPDFIADHLDRALRHMWRRWCEGLPPESFVTTSEDAPNERA